MEVIIIEVVLVKNDCENFHTFLFSYFHLRSDLELVKKKSKLPAVIFLLSQIPRNNYSLMSVIFHMGELVVVRGSQIWRVRM